MKKTSKKNNTFSPKFIADFSNVTTTDDALISLAMAKISVREPITEDELDAITNKVKDMTINAIFAGYNCAVIGKDGELKRFNVEPTTQDEIAKEVIAEQAKKEPWYKRIWNKITRKK